MVNRIDAIAFPCPGIEKKRMVGGLCYLLGGLIAFGIQHDELIVRLGCEDDSELDHWPREGRGHAGKAC